MMPCKNEFCNWCAYKSLCPEFNDPNEINKKLVQIKEEKKKISEILDGVKSKIDEKEDKIQDVK